MRYRRFAVFCAFIVLPILAFAAKPDLKLHLSFEEGKGDTVKDQSGNGNDGKIIGDAKWGAGKFGSGLELSGAGYVEVPDKNNSGFDNVEGLTIGVWVKQETHHDNGIVVKLTTNAFWPCSYNLETWSDTNMWFGVDQDAKAISAGGYPLNEWFHFVGVFDGKAQKQSVYLNGKKVAEGAATVKTVPDGEKPVWIGTVDPNTFKFKGSLDDVVIYSRALTEAEIQADMKGIILAVQPQGKLASAWSGLKSGRGTFPMLWRD